MECLDFIDEDFNNLPASQQNYKDNFEHQHSCFFRNFFMTQILSYLMHVKRQLQKNREQKELQTSQLKNIKFDSSSEYLGKRMADQLKKIASILKKGEGFNQSNILSVIYACLKVDIIKTGIFFLFDAIFRIAVTLSIMFLLRALNQLKYETAYIMVALLTLSWYLQQLFKIQGFKQSGILATRIKSGILLLLYAKISKLSSYTIKSSQMGTLTNILANDIGVIQNRLGYLMNSLSFPITVIGITIILLINVGWPGIVGLILIILIVPLANCISKRNGSIIQEINVQKDKRMQLTVQIIQGVKSIKLYGWQIAFQKIIKKIRKQQIRGLKKLAFGRSLQRSLGNFIGYLSGLVIIILAHYFNNNDIGIVEIFITLSMINSLKVTILNLAEGLGLFYQLKIIFGRFAKIINIKNVSMQRIDQSSKEHINQQKNQTQQELVASNLNRKFEKEIVFQVMQNQLSKGDIIFNNFNGYWKSDLTVASLKNINLQFKKGIFYGITGRVGSGKSGILGVILQQIPYYSGYFDLNGSVSYVEQEPFLFSLSIKQNILSGKAYQQQLYQQVLKDSCLNSDLELMIDADQTMVGQKGVTLSGGQKARLSLARSLYANTQIMLLDDPISAVDSNVAKRIYENCLKKISKMKTVILVTHQINFLQECDIIIILQEGEVNSKGSPKQLAIQLHELRNTKDIQQKINSHKRIHQQLQEEERQSIISSIKRFRLSNLSSKKTSLKRKAAINSIILTSNSLIIDQIEKNQQIPQEEQFYEKTVKVTFKTYITYIFSNKINYIMFPITILLFIISQGILTAYFRLLGDYLNISNSSSKTLNGNIDLYWGIIGALIGLLLIVLILKFYLFNLCIINSNEKIHQQMIFGILRSPAYYFDKHPSGMLINKFSNDLGILENSLGYCFVDVLQGPVSSLVALINICVINVYFIPPVTIILIISIVFYLYTKQTIISCNQLDQKNKSPIFNLYNQTVGGVIQIKIFKRRRRLIQNLASIVNNCVKVTQALYLISNGFAFIAFILALIMMTIGLMIGISMVNKDSFGLYGVTIVFLIGFSEYFHWFLRQMILTQSLMLSCQRVFEIINLQSQKQLRNQYDCQIGLVQQVEAHQKKLNFHKNWPINSRIQFHQFSASYQPNHPLALKNISFEVKAKSKVGIVGRTGAGKSSIIQAIFRIIQPNQGSIYKIDSFNALKMGLHSLRQHISVIPQIPFLFKGTIRQNIDPFESASELQIWNVLKQSKLDIHVKSLPLQLQTDILNSSESFSVGQKQLLCLARALLRRNDILILDQATSNVDMETDNFIQSVIKEQFKDTTVITIAHRLNTIADYDNIIVMKGGQIIQTGSPFQLISKNGAFCEMVMNTGKNAEVIIKKAQKSFYQNEKLMIQI